MNNRFVRRVINGLAIVPLIALSFLVSTIGPAEVEAAPTTKPRIKRAARPAKAIRQQRGRSVARQQRVRPPRQPRIARQRNVRTARGFVRRGRAAAAPTMAPVAPVAVLAPAPAPVAALAPTLAPVPAPSAAPAVVPASVAAPAPQVAPPPPPPAAPPPAPGAGAPPPFPAAPPPPPAPQVAVPGAPAQPPADLMAQIKGGKQLRAVALGVVPGAQPAPQPQPQPQPQEGVVGFFANSPLFKKVFTPAANLLGIQIPQAQQITPVTQPSAQDLQLQEEQRKREEAGKKLKKQLKQARKAAIAREQAQVNQGAAPAPQPLGQPQAQNPQDLLAGGGIPVPPPPTPSAGAGAPPPPPPPAGSPPPADQNQLPQPTGMFGKLKNLTNTALGKTQQATESVMGVIANTVNVRRLAWTSHESDAEIRETLLFLVDKKNKLENKQLLTKKDNKELKTTEKEIEKQFKKVKRGGYKGNFDDYLKI